MPMLFMFRLQSEPGELVGSVAGNLATARTRSPRALAQRWIRVRRVEAFREQNGKRQTFKFAPARGGGCGAAVNLPPQRKISCLATSQIATTAGFLILLSTEIA